MQKHASSQSSLSSAAAISSPDVSVTLGERTGDLLPLLLLLLALGPPVVLLLLLQLLLLLALPPPVVILLAATC
jgi:hypothetical protein